MACANTNSVETVTNADGTVVNVTEAATNAGGTKDVKCTNGVSQFVLAPIIAFASLCALLA